MSEIIVYTMKHCPNCDKLKEALKTMCVEFEERDIETKEAIIDLRCFGCYPKEAPVLIYGNNCFESQVILNENGIVNNQIIPRISSKAA